MDRVRLLLGAALLGISVTAASHADAACSVPNTLTNGQVADATQVMANFAAIAACTDTAVTISGSPTSGRIAVFSAGNAITGGNLTGDVTTSGGTATSLSPSGVTPGNYFAANITVDSKGRVTAASHGSGGGGGGGGGSNERALLRPVVSSFTLENAGTATISDGNNGLILNAPGAGTSVRFVRVNASLPSAPYSFIFKGVPHGPQAAASYHVSAVVRNSANGHLIVTGWYYGNYFLIQRFNNYSSYHSNIIGAEQVADMLPWQKVTVTSTDVSFYTSWDGLDWHLWGTESISTFLGAVDQVGFGVMINASGINMTNSFQSFEFE